MLYSEAMERKSHSVGVDGIKACGDSVGPSNRVTRVAAILSCVSEVENSGGGGD